MTYAAETQMRLAMRGLVITQDQINEAIDLAAPRGLIGRDAETSLYTYLERLSLYGKWNHGDYTEGEPEVVFPGWAAMRDQMHADLDGLSIVDLNRELAARFGLDAVRIANVIWQATDVR